MVVYIQKASLLKKGIPFIFEITSVNYRIIFGRFYDLKKIPALFEASHLIDGDGKLCSIYEEDLRWFHCETVDKLLIFDHFRMPHYVKQNDKLLYLE